MAECPLCHAFVDPPPKVDAGDLKCPSCDEAHWFIRTSYGPNVYEAGVVGPPSMRDRYADMVSRRTDSLDAVEFVMELLDESDFVVPDEDFERIHGVADLIDYLIQRRLAQQDP